MNLTNLLKNAVPQYAPDHLIVKFKDGTVPSEIDQIKNDLGVSVVKEIKLTGAQIWEFSGSKTVAQIIDEYGKNPVINYIEPDYLIKVPSPNTDGQSIPTGSQSSVNQVATDPAFGALWGLNNTGQLGGKPDADIDAPEAWDLNPGNGVVVAVIDTGVDYTHPDLQNNIWTNPGEIAGNGIDDDGNGYVDDIHGYDFVNGDGDPMDDDSHGTHVAGTIAAEANNGIGVTGVNPNAQIMALKFLGADGYGYISDAILALDYATTMGVKITNNSWGFTDYYGEYVEEGLYDAIKAAGEEGSLFVVAAGNDSNDNDGYYPDYPSVFDLDNIIAVAATDQNDNLAWFSSYGATSIDLGAPGDLILSTIPGGNYEFYSGTSMATPHVAGVLSLLMSEYPDASAEEIKGRLLNGVDPIEALAGKTLTGGRLNALNALANQTPVVNVTATDATASEIADIGTFTLTRWFNLNSPLTVNYTLTGTAVNGTDYDSLPGSVTFAAGSSTATITVNPIDELGAERGETVTLTPVAGTGYTPGSPASVTIAPSDITYKNFSNTNQITINDGDSGTPYPSTINVSGMTGTIVDVKVSLNKLSHTWPSDIDVLLESPTGAKTLLMSDAGAPNFYYGVSNINLLFDQSASNYLPPYDLTSGTYLPTNYGSGDTFDSPAPAGPYEADLSVFDNTNPNGAWKLYVMDDVFGDSGEIAGGWVIAISTLESTIAPTPTLNLSADKTVVEGTTIPQNVAYTVSLVNPGSETVTVQYSTANGSAQAGSDYGSTSGTLTFTPGQTTKSIQIPIVNNSANEANESFTLTLSNPTNATLGSAVATTTITDTLSANVTKTLPANVENLNLTGTAVINGTGNTGNNIITGNPGNNTLTGLAGNDILNGRAGDDTLYGGIGNDTYVVDSINDKVNETSTVGTEVDTVKSTVNYTLGANLENLTLTGTANNGIGNGRNNFLRGNAEANFLNGSAANDTLIGAEGNDTLVGGAGKDRLTGGAGSDKFNYKTLTDSLLASFDVITDFNTGGVDKFLVTTARAGFTDAGAVASLNSAGITAKLNNTNFAANYAAKFTFGSQTFVAINNAVAGFDANTDAIVEVTGFSPTLNLSSFTTV